MALNRYFQASEKSSCKLPNPRGPLSRLVPSSSSIVSANEKVQCVGKQGSHSEWAKGTTLRQALSRTEGRNRQAGSRAHCYNQGIRDCWAMGVVNLNLEVGGASTGWRSSKIKSRKFSQGLSAKF